MTYLMGDHVVYANGGSADEFRIEVDAPVFVCASKTALVPAHETKLKADVPLPPLCQCA
jgi:hypothetical protein